MSKNRYYTESAYTRLVYFVNLWLEYDTTKRLQDMIAAEQAAIKELEWGEFVWWINEEPQEKRIHD